jgi:3'-5' exoribonuclease
MRKYLKEVEEFPQELRLQLEHIILSHHGQRDWGSPVVPQTPEAIFVHYLDDMDAKTNMVFRAIKTDPNMGEEFTQFHKGLKRHFYKVRPDENLPDEVGEGADEPLGE